MDKNQYNLCIEVIKAFAKQGLLNDIILVGSWCVPIYKNYFQSSEYRSTILTRDVDFLIHSPDKITVKVDVPDELMKLGFIKDASYTTGGKALTKLLHPDLIIEFLVPLYGRGKEISHYLKNLSISAQKVRFLDFLLTSTIAIKIEDINISVPHPAYFAVHKFLTALRRDKANKAEKDIRAGLHIIGALIRKNEAYLIKQALGALQKRSKKWHKKVIELLKKEDEEYKSEYLF